MVYQKKDGQAPHSGSDDWPYWRPSFSACTQSGPVPLLTGGEHPGAVVYMKAQALNENAALQRKIAFAKTSEYVERVAREQLGLLKKNEVRFVAGGN